MIIIKKKKKRVGGVKNETDCVGAERVVEEAAEPPEFTGRRHFTGETVRIGLAPGGIFLLLRDAVV